MLKQGTSVPGSGLILCATTLNLRTRILKPAMITSVLFFFLKGNAHLEKKENPKPKKTRLDSI